MLVFIIYLALMVNNMILLHGDSHTEMRLEKVIVRPAHAGWIVSTRRKP